MPVRYITSRPPAPGGLHPPDPWPPGPPGLCEGVLIVSYQLAPEQQDLRVFVAQFAREVVAPVIGDYYERGEFPYDIVAKMGKLGLFGLPFPRSTAA
jgi:alkylation response protein AidB-like acyl-CoA dehydrogenase